MKDAKRPWKKPASAKWPRHSPDGLDCLGCCQLRRPTCGRCCTGINLFTCRKRYLEIPVFL